MANKLIDMSKVRKVIQFHHQGKAKQFISRYMGLSRNTVKKYIALYRVLNLTIDEINQKSDSELEKIFSRDTEDVLSPKLKKVYDFFPHMERELKKTGVTKHRMWKEYHQKHPEGLKLSQFKAHYLRWSKKVNPVMHMEHKAGDKMFIDYAGKTLEIINKETGEVEQVQFFVAILGASQYTYAEASPSQQKEDFITSVENALHFYGGVPAAIVPDNLKSAVIRSSRFEPTINETFMDFAEHYGTTVLPARAYRPRDKSLAEGAVKILYQRIYPVLRGQKFYCLDELNNAIWDELDKHNNKKLTGRPTSRHQLFIEDEKAQLAPLPVEKYEIKEISMATVAMNGHVLLSKDQHYYSVPCQYLKKKVKLVYTSASVEIYHKYNRIALHKRDGRKYFYTTNKDHLASTHQFVAAWTPQRFINWASSIDHSVKEFIINILERKQHPEQAYKSCMGVLSFAKKVGNERLTNACKRALEHQVYNYRIIQKILEKGLDKIDNEKPDEPELPFHDNIRGRKYYN
ncbi:IS21 family transposase [Carboxylicivirga marina]|uniref:IS21 family transposase n=1 Tax=Carboxylicivirga marina TaxID=2800988 RepID=A0ABS1HRN7_9BACT|nr:IS21 family transposase [Carboxylicivirga marina]MBK3519913.1 IS21 family transposase [Carboxylicivirga marina]